MLAEISGTMQVTGDKMSKTITIHDQEGNYREYVVSARAQLLPGVFDGCEMCIRDSHRILCRWFVALFRVGVRRPASSRNKGPFQPYFPENFHGS